MAERGVARHLARVDRRAALGALVLLTLALRLIAVGDPLSHHEGYTWLVSSAPDGHAFLARLARFENTPPLSYLLVWPLPKDHELWLRLPALVAGVGSVSVLYAIVRPLLGTAVALLAALGLAVAPYHVSFSDYARGFTLSVLAMLLVLWAAARLGQRGSRRWWALWLAGAVAGVYSEYAAGLFLAALTVVMLVLGTPRRRETLAAFALACLAFAPWLHQYHRAHELIGVTKAIPTQGDGTPRGLARVLVPLAFGENGTAGLGAVRGLQLLAILGACGLAAWLLWRGSRGPGGAGRRLALWLFGATALITVALHASISGADLFAQRYLTILIPFGTALIAGGVGELRLHHARTLAFAALAALAPAVIVSRSTLHAEPSFAPVRAAVDQAHVRTVLTNSAVVDWYLRSRGAVLDRPFGLGPGAETYSRGTAPPPWRWSTTPASAPARARGSAASRATARSGCGCAQMADSDCRECGNKESAI